MRLQLWRPYRQLLELTDDLTAEWILELWAMAPTPAEAARLREATIAKLLSQHRIRRLDAAGVLGVLRRPAITVAAGGTEAAGPPPRSPAPAGLMPQACSASCAGPRSRSPRASTRPPSCTCTPCWPGCAWPTPSSA